MRVRVRTSCLFGLCLLLAACASIGPPEPPSLELPKPPSDLRARRKGNRVILTWTVPRLTTDRQTVRNPGPTRICRTSDPALHKCGVPVGEVAASPHDKSQPPEQKVAASYTDALPAQLESDNPIAFAGYAVEVLNGSGRSAGLSNTARVPLAPTLPPPQDFHADASAAGVVLTWRGTIVQLPAEASLRYVYRVYRRPETGQQTLVGSLAAEGGPNFALTDNGIEWQQTYYYHAEAVSVIQLPGQEEMEVEGEDCPEIKIFADDVFPPAVPSDLQAVSGSGQAPSIDLIWAPVTDTDLAGYNVYRHEPGEQPVRLNADLVKTPAYRDSNVVSGKNYLYSVSAVDARGNESARSQEAGERVP